MLDDLIDSIHDLVKPLSKFLVTISTLQASARKVAFRSMKILSLILVLFQEGVKEEDEEGLISSTKNKKKEDADMLISKEMEDEIADFSD